MNRKRKSQTENVSSKIPRIEEDETDEDADPLKPSFPVCNDTEAGIQYIRNIILKCKKLYPFPPVVFVHQIFNIIQNRTTVNRQIENLRNEKKIVLIHMGSDENMKIVVFHDDLKNHVLAEKTKSETMLFQKFFDKVLLSTRDIGISKTDLLIKHRFSEADVRTLVNAGLLILKETGIFWFSFPSAGAFMKRVLKGRQIILQIIRKRRYREILQTELEKRKLDKSLELPLHYLIHDLVGGKVLKCVETTSGALLRSST
ncbi:inactive serine/threonine-protein kinase 19-like [Planococcus citri]|uniref:inactive serine/threonine-protein kinase 19-like n=1 Tax=Planococcus citri TaxID=170843 RepID=UPI0031F96293